MIDSGVRLAVLAVGSEKTEYVFATQLKKDVKNEEEYILEKGD
jgi:hypothetical protein